MNRFLALIGALFLSFVTIASACAAVAPQWIHFTLEPMRGSERIEASFRSDGAEDHNDWSSGFRPAELVGLDLAGFRAAGAHPLRFSLMREAGRLDCSGSGGNSSAAGSCDVTLEPGFARLLASRGIHPPSRDQALGLVALNVRRDLIEALAAARYPIPSVDDLMGLTALGVDGNYVSGMVRAGYRPNRLEDLLQFKALDVTPEYIAGFDRLGYRSLPAHTLVELKAMDITPEFVRSVAGDGQPMPDVGKLIELKIFGGRR
jgi:hypothetical protein